MRLKVSRIKGNTIVANKLIWRRVILPDIFELLDRKKIFIEAKPFALGVRAEHPQSLIDSIQYSCDYRGRVVTASTI
jgi:uncharacterized FAD-dependent dehydrogenase